MDHRWRRWLGVVLALAMVVAGIVRLEQARDGLVLTEASVGQTPVRVYAQPAATGPVVVVAHGFAGSRQMMESYALTLARAGYRVHSFDFEGHGRNPVPMSGDVTVIEGTTARLVAQTRRVMDAARATAPGAPLALLGHSMASDVIVRAALADGDVAAVVGISMFSEAVTPDQPQHLLMITGAGEPHLRAAALRALRMVDPDASAGQTVQAGPVTRRAVTAPMVEHVGVLYSRTALAEARAFLDRTFGRDGGSDPVTNTGPWLLLALTGVVLLTRYLVAVLPAPATAPRQYAPLGRARFALVCLAPALITPLALAMLPDLPPLLPVLVADALALHLGVYGLIQLALLGLMGRGPQLGGAGLVAALALAAWGVLAFGGVLDTYGASFSAHGGRWPLVAALLLGTVPYMLADALLTGRPGTPFLARGFARVALLGSLSLAVALNPEELFFLVIVMPVIVLFVIVFGLMGRWVGRRSGPTAAGLGLGVILAYALGVTFPMFVV